MVMYKILCFIKMLTKMNNDTIVSAKEISKQFSIEHTGSKGLQSNYFKKELLNRLLSTLSSYDLLLIVLFFHK